MYYVFFDEIQNVEDFPKVVDSLNLKSNIDLYLTGSNAYMLSSEIATFLSGRYVEIKMLPLSFKEYVDSTGNRKDLGQKYTNYLKFSSFPYAIMLEENEEVDFVAMNDKGQYYYQVAATVRDEATLARELRPLQKISDHYPKIILTLDEDPDADYDGIRRTNALKFLLGDQYSK